MRGQLAGPIREASGYIKAFITDLLGEHAAAVVMTVASNAGSIPRGGHHRAGAGGASANSHLRVADKPRLNGRTTTGKIASIVQHTAFETYRVLNYAVKGLLGEHIVDHHVIEQKGWGLSWNRHDMIGGPGKKTAGWQSEFKKLNDNEVPLYLCTPSAHVLTNGIDSLWITNRSTPIKYAVVEAKANMSPAATLNQMLGEAKASEDTQSGPGRGRKKNQRPAAGTGAGTGTGTKSPTAMTMQMSRDWIRKRVKRDFPMHQDAILRGAGNYSRHVFLVTPLQASEHMIALEKIMQEKLISNPKAAQKYAPEHAKHNVHKEFGEHDLDNAEAHYRQFGKPKKTKKKK